jgi:hypothetical protein
VILLCDVIGTLCEVGGNGWLWELQSFQEIRLLFSGSRRSEAVGAAHGPRPVVPE